MPVTAYHVLHQTFTSIDKKTSTQVGKEILISEFYFNEEEAIAHYRALYEGHYIDIFRKNPMAPSKDKVKESLVTKGFSGLTLYSTPIIKWSIQIITIN